MGKVRAHSANNSGTDDYQITAINFWGFLVVKRDCVMALFAS
jgi:hypothetical protein